MKDFFRQNGILLLVIAFLLSVLIGVFSFVMGGQADPLSNLVNTITAPVRGGVSAAADWLEGLGYLDDAAYARRVAEHWMSSSKNRHRCPTRWRGEASEWPAM